MARAAPRRNHSKETKAGANQQHGIGDDYQLVVEVTKTHFDSQSDLSEIYKSLQCPGTRRPGRQDGPRFGFCIRVITNTIPVNVVEPNVILRLNPSRRQGVF